MNCGFPLSLTLHYKKAHVCAMCSQANHFRMTSSNENTFRVTGHLCGEFTGHRWIPHTKTSDVELWCFLWSPDKRLSKQWGGWWFETPSRPLWRHCNVIIPILNSWCPFKHTDGAIIRNSIKCLLNRKFVVYSTIYRARIKKKTPS